MDAETEKYDGYLFKIENSIMGQSRKKFWFILPFDSPTLYWFKNASDFQCAGRVSLSGAAFTYNPRENGIFEIHVNNSVLLLEAPNNKLRTEWLRMLQMSRKRYYERNFSTGDEKTNLNSFLDASPLTSDAAKNQEKEEKNEGTIAMHSELPSFSEAAEKNADALVASSSQSTFYLSENGELNRHSLYVPDEQQRGYSRCDASVSTAAPSQHWEEMWARASAEAHIIEKELVNLPTKRIINKARESMRKLSESRNNNQNKECRCDRCAENLEISSQLRNRCFELTDELVANHDLISALKRSLVTAHNQRDALEKICNENSTVEDKLDMILEREGVITNLQCTLTELRRELEYYKEQNRCLESENSSLNSVIDAFKESIRTKDELILKFYDNPYANLTSTEVIQLNKRDSFVQEVPEAILFDSNNTEADKDVKRVISEANVNDVTELKDLVDGYASQNKFLNNEVLELQQIVQSLENRERKLIQQNFDIEAIYYQLKSRYIMVLNHFRLSTHPNRLLDPTFVQNLINEVAQPPSSNGTNLLSQIFPTATNSSLASTSSVVDPKTYAMLLSPYKNLNHLSPLTMDPETDSLGFYLNSPRSRFQTPMAMMAITRLSTSIGANVMTNNPDDEETRLPNSSESRSLSPASESSCVLDVPPGSSLPSPVDLTKREQTSIKTGDILELSPSTSLLNSKSSDPTKEDWMIRVAAHLKKRSDDIRENIALANNHEYIEWLQKWDAFLVNHVLQPLPDPGINSELKALIRLGISHAYRSRIWKSLVFHYVGTTEAEMGKGYYECLIRKATNFQDKVADCALKQIDLDLGRTLPTNKQFDREDSEKSQALKRVLYAFRFHNKSVEYCQGLNRIAAIGLLYLSEADAFWFLVACVEHLQPPNYYDHNLLGAVIDQKILLDLMQKKLPTLWEHFRKMEVDVSLFTLNWFLTIFVDALTHNIYINIFDVFLYEGNKVLFRFALALLKLCEPRILECSSLTGVQACLSNLSALSVDYKTLANIAFKQLNPFPSKTIETRRQTYLNLHQFL